MNNLLEVYSSPPLINDGSYLAHYGVLGMKWGIRRYQPYPKGYRGSGKYTGKEKTVQRKTRLTSMPNLFVSSRNNKVKEQRKVVKEAENVALETGSPFKYRTYNKEKSKLEKSKYGLNKSALKDVGVPRERIKEIIKTNTKGLGKDRIPTLNDRMGKELQSIYSKNMDEIVKRGLPEEYGNYKIQSVASQVRAIKLMDKAIGKSIRIENKKKKK